MVGASWACLVGTAYSGRSVYLSDETGGYSESVGMTVMVGTLQRHTEKDHTYTAMLMSIRHHGTPDDIGLLLAVPASVTVPIGSVLSFTGRVSAFEPIGTFDYPGYMRSQGIYGRVSPYRWDTVGRDVGIVTRTIEDVRDAVRTTVKTLYPPDTGDLLLGLLIGDRTGMDSVTRTDFVRSGLMHIVAVSGYNITLLATFLSAMLILAPVWLRTGVVVLGILLFSLLVGDQAPVERAALMGMIGYLVFAGGRRIRMMPVLVGVVCLFALIDPLALALDPSLQLSCLALVGVVALGPQVDRLLRWCPRLMGIRLSVAITLSAIIATLPIIAIDFGQVSVVSIVADLFVAPVIPIAMLAGALSAALSPVWGLGAYGVGYVAQLTLAWILWVVHASGSLSFASYAVPPIPWGGWLQVVLVSVLFVVVARREECVGDGRR